MREAISVVHQTMLLITFLVYKLETHNWLFKVRSIYQYINDFPHIVPPIVVVMSVSPLGVVNQTVTLSFAIQNASPPVSLKHIKWTFNNTVINEGSIPSRFNFSSDLLSLTVSDLKHSDQGSYTLTAVNEAGTNSSAVFLEIQGLNHQQTGICYFVCYSCSSDINWSQ